MKVILLLISLLSISLCFSDQEDHLVLETNKGIVVIDLNTEDAPYHFAQITKLVELGIYNGLSFNYASSNFFVQLGGESYRKHAFFPVQKQAIIPMKNELTEFKHLRGSVTMPSDTDSDLKGGSYLLTFLLDKSEALDQKQTIIGFITRGIEVLDKISNQKVEGDILFEPIMINQASLQTKTDAIKKYDQFEKSFFSNDIVLFNLCVFIFILLIQLVVYHIKDKLDMAYMNAINLIVFLSCVFSILVFIYPMARESSLISIGVVLLLLQSFKMMSSLEFSRS